MTTAQEAINMIEEKMKAKPELSASINAVFQFNIEGDGGGTWNLDFTKTPGELNEGGADNPACTITMTTEDFYAMINKTANPMQLYMSQKLKVAGNLPLSLKLQEILA